MTPDQLANELENSNLSQGAAAAAAIRGGWRVDLVSENSSCEELASTYAIRLAVLREKSSSHANQLALSTEELVENLGKYSSSSFTWIRISGDTQFTFAVVCLAESNTPLGCLRVVSQLDVPPERWREIWSDA